MFIQSGFSSGPFNAQRLILLRGIDAGVTLFTATATGAVAGTRKKLASASVSAGSTVTAQAAWVGSRSVALVSRGVLTPTPATVSGGQATLLGKARIGVFVPLTRSGAATLIGQSHVVATATGALGEVEDPVGVVTLLASATRVQHGIAPVIGYATLGASTPTVQSWQAASCVGRSTLYGEGSRNGLNESLAHFSATATLSQDAPFSQISRAALTSRAVVSVNAARQQRAASHGSAEAVLAGTALSAIPAQAAWIGRATASGKVVAYTPTSSAGIGRSIVLPTLTAVRATASEVRGTVTLSPPAGGRITRGISASVARATMTLSAIRAIRYMEAAVLTPSHVTAFGLRLQPGEAFATALASASASAWRRGYGIAQPLGAGSLSGAAKATLAGNALLGGSALLSGVGTRKHLATAALEGAGITTALAWPINKYFGESAPSSTSVVIAEVTIYRATAVATHTGASVVTGWGQRKRLADSVCTGDSFFTALAFGNVAYPAPIDRQMRAYRENYRMQVLT